MVNIPLAIIVLALGSVAFMMAFPDAFPNFQLFFSNIPVIQDDPPPPPVERPSIADKEVNFYVGSDNVGASGGAQQPPPPPPPPATLTVALNAGTLGSSGNAFYTEAGIDSEFVTTTGIIGQGVTKNGTSSGNTDGEIIIGINPDTWKFLHAGNVGSNITSINFWLNGDVIGAPVYPLIGTGRTDFGSGTGFHLWTQSGTNGKLTIFETSDEQVVSGSTIGSVPPDDAGWHMVSFMMNQGNRTGDFAILCIDAVCDTGVDAQSSPFSDLTSGGNSPFTNMTIGGGSPFGNSVTQNTFDFDDLTIWNGYQLTQSDIDDMWDGGTGSSAGATGESIATGSQLVHITFDTII